MKLFYKYYFIFLSSVLFLSVTSRAEKIVINSKENTYLENVKQEIRSLPAWKRTVFSTSCSLTIGYITSFSVEYLKINFEKNILFPLMNQPKIDTVITKHVKSNKAIYAAYVFSLIAIYPLMFFLVEKSTALYIDNKIQKETLGLIAHKTSLKRTSFQVVLHMVGAFCRSRSLIFRHNLTSNV